MNSFYKYFSITLKIIFLHFSEKQSQIIKYNTTTLLVVFYTFLALSPFLTACFILSRENKIEESEFSSLSMMTHFAILLEATLTSKDRVIYQDWQFRTLEFMNSTDVWNHLVNHLVNLGEAIVSHWAHILDF